jgi:hypothetical protein
MGSAGEAGRRLWLQWVAANALGLAAGMALFGVLDDTVGELGDTGDAIAHLGGLPLAATVFGLCQWLILRRYAQRSAWGIVGAAIGLTLGYLGGFLIADGGADFVVGFALMGIGSGLVQWLVLRQRYMRSGWWAAASGAGFTIGAVVAVGIAVAGLGDRLGSGIVAYVALSSFFGLVAGAAGGGLTALVLSRLRMRATSA